MSTTPDPGGGLERARIAIPAEVDRLADVRAFVRARVTEAGCAKAVADDLVQAVDEAVCNVMLHGYGDEPGEIEVESAIRDGAIEITILDRAPVFDPTAGPEAQPSGPPTPRRRGGMGVGVHLLRTMTDSVRHDVRPGGGNQLTLVRSLEDGAKEA